MNKTLIILIILILCTFTYSYSHIYNFDVEKNKILTVDGVCENLRYIRLFGLFSECTLLLNNNYTIRLPSNKLCYFDNLHTIPTNYNHWHNYTIMAKSNINGKVSLIVNETDVKYTIFTDKISICVMVSLTIIIFAYMYVMYYIAKNNTVYSNKCNNKKYA